MFKIRTVMVMIFFVFITTFAIHASNFVFKEYSVGDVADKDITSPRSITYEDEQSTEDLKKKAIENVQNVYEPDPTLFNVVSVDLESFFSSLVDTKQKISQKSSELQRTNEDFNFDEYYKQQISSIKNPFSFDTVEIELFLTLENRELTQMKEIYTKELEKIFVSGILEEKVEELRNKFTSNETLAYFFPKDVNELLSNKLSEYIVPNLVYNEALTKEKIDDALEQVEPVYKRIQKNEIIIRYGDVITEEQIEKLYHSGILKSDLDYKVLFKNLPYIGLLFLIMHIYCFKFHSSRFHVFKNYIFLFGLFSLSILSTNIISYDRLYFLPFLTALIIIVSLWGRMMVLFSSVILGMLFTIKIGNDLHFLILFILSGIVLSFRFNHKGKREDLIFSGLITGLVLVFSNAIISISIEQSFDFDSILESSIILLSSAFFASFFSVEIGRAHV